MIVLLTLVLFALAYSSASAVTALGPGYYQNTDSSLVYTGTWTTGTSNSGSYGGSFASTTSTSARVEFYTLPTVNAFGLYYAMNSFSGTFQIVINDLIAYGPYNSYNGVPLLNQYLQISLPAGTNKVAISSASNSFYYHAVQLLALPATVVVSLPTHTPTPTATPTLTPTAGPSPTPTATPTATPNFLARSVIETEDGQQDVGVLFQMSAGDVGIVLAIAVLIGLQVVTMFMMIRREK